MNYKLPIYSDEEIANATTSYPPLENGRYDFKVVERKQGYSKNNNPQEKLVFEVYHRGKNNKAKTCYHNFTFNNPGDPGHMWLIGLAKQFLNCVGVQYTADAFDKVIGKEGNALFLVDTYTKDGKEREKFVVPNEGFAGDLDRNVAPASKVATQENKKAESFDDDIPF